MKLKACIIGDSAQGGFGHEFDVAFTGYEEIEVVGLSEEDPEARAEAAQRAGAPRTYADYREMLEKERPDLVSIAPRWSTRHAEFLLSAAEAGAHGIIEKPISIDLAESDRMIEAVEAKNLKWSVGHQTSAAPNFLHARKLIRQGIIGEVLEARARGKEDARAGGEDLVVLGTHLCDALVSLFGEPKSCSAFIAVSGAAATLSDARLPAEGIGPVLGDRLIADYTFDGALPVSFRSISHGGSKESRFGLDVYGSKGMIKMRWGVPATILWRPGSDWISQSEEGWRPLPDLPDMQPSYAGSLRNRDLVLDLLAAIREDRLPEVSLQRARWAQEMIQGAFASHLAGGRRLPLPLPPEWRPHPLLKDS